MPTEPISPRSQRSTRRSVAVAATAALDGHRLIQLGTFIPDTQLQRYWQMARHQLRNWDRILEQGLVYLSSDETDRHRHAWHECEPVLQELFINEILLRVWGSVLTAMDLESGNRHAAPWAKSVLLTQQQVRRRALEFLVQCTAPVNVWHTGQAPTSECRAEPSNGRFEIADSSYIEMDRLRRKCERWTDILLGQWVVAFNLDQFAFDANRSREFGEEQIETDATFEEHSYWEFVHAGLAGAFSSDRLPALSERDENALVEAVVDAFPPRVAPPHIELLALLSGAEEFNRKEYESDHLEFGSPPPSAKPAGESRRPESSSEILRFRHLRERVSDESPCSDNRHMDFPSR